MKNTKTIYCAILAGIDESNTPPHNPHSIYDFKARTPEELDRMIAEVIREPLDDDDLEEQGLTEEDIKELDADRPRGNARLIEVATWPIHINDMYEGCDTSDEIDRNILLCGYYSRTTEETNNKDGLLRYEVKSEGKPDELVKAIQEALDDLLVGGALSKETKIDALRKCIDKIATE
jgi:hypothetical protein